MSLIFPEFNQISNIEEIKYVLGLDLSTVSTGMVLYDVRGDIALESWALRYKSEDKNKIYEMGNCITKLFEAWVEKYNIKKNNLLFAKEKQPIQYGMKTTIMTLVSIAKLHGLVEKYAYDNKIMVVDIAVPTIRKTVLGKAKAEKEEMFEFINSHFTECLLDKRAGGADMADAIAVCLSAKGSLVKDIEENIKELKKLKRKYKTAKKRESIENQIKELRKVIE